jgi:hypothetical protein
MVELNKENLEDALSQPRAGEENPMNAGSSPTNEGKSPQNKANQVSNQEEIGFHKGALNTLVNERNELVKIIQNVETVMQAHIKRLEQLGVKVPVQGQEKNNFY